MFWILALVALIFIGIVAVTVLSFTLHLLFSPWLLLLALGVLVCVTFRRRRSHR
jgi:hypothetical protein